MLRCTCHDAIEDEQELDRRGEGCNYHGTGRDQTSCHHHSTMTKFIGHNTRQRACNGQKIIFDIFSYIQT